MKPPHLADVKHSRRIAAADAGTTGSGEEDLQGAWLGIRVSPENKDLVVC